MPDLRIGLVELAPTHEVLDLVRDALSQEPAWTPVIGPPGDASAPGEAEVVVALVGGRRLDEVCQTVQHFRGERPRAALILVVDEDISYAALTGLLAAGADDILTQPLRPQELLARVARAAGTLPTGIPATACLVKHRELIGHSPAFQRQLTRLPMIAGCDAGVLILGETGTGKEIFAQAVHYSSARADGPWVAVNCAAIPTDLIEDELFGHVRGAFTQAHLARPGLVEEAERGTLFLDEIDALPYNAQAKLLRFLNDKEYRAVGSNALHRADVRVIAASNGDLGALAARGQFRQDLYYRLNVLTLALPPLRERIEDIPLLAQHFVLAAGRDAKRPVTGISPLALERLMGHDWPGNVRELKHVIERAVVLTQNAILQVGDMEIADQAQDPGEAESFRDAKARMVERFERGYIERLLVASDGNISRAARTAKKNRRAFFELMRKYGIDPECYRTATP